MIRYALLSVLAFVLAACGGDTPGDDSAPTAETAAPPSDAHPPADPVPAQMEGDVQVVEIAVTPSGYTPSSVLLRAGVPARLLFTRTEDGGCAQQVKAPDLGVRATDLPLNEAVVVAFTPSEAGTFAFTCGMDMLSGQIVVQS